MQCIICTLAHNQFLKMDVGCTFYNKHLIACSVALSAHVLSVPISSHLALVMYEQCSGSVGSWALITLSHNHHPHVSGGVMLLHCVPDFHFHDE